MAAGVDDGEIGELDHALFQHLIESVGAHGPQNRAKAMQILRARLKDYYDRLEREKIEKER
ncbi:MAG TPA: hypothetical protein ENJ19_09165, partial [Gammaproteobacteria bacterium]|nr:hypothetical protein [Gammaproteobacteria bacterium]